MSRAITTKLLPYPKRSIRPRNRICSRLICFTTRLHFFSSKKAFRPFGCVYILLRDMTSIISSHRCNWSFGVQENVNIGIGFSKVLFPGCNGSYFPSRGLGFSNGNCHIRHQSDRRHRPIFSSTTDDGNDINPDDSEDPSDAKENGGVDNSEMLRDNLERLVGRDDSAFSGIDLATLIRNKYGRSYDVQLIKKEFLGRNLLALNVMWKYMEQRSFPLTEEEYLLRLDDVANTLKCWGAVSHIRNSLATVKERPRIGKAVSIFIDMDESGGRANEWIYK